MSSFVHKVHAMSQPLFVAFTSVNCIVNEIASFQIRLQSLGMEILTGQLTGKPVKVDNLPVYRWSSKSLQFPALLGMPVFEIKEPTSHSLPRRSWALPRVGP